MDCRDPLKGLKILSKIHSRSHKNWGRVWSGDDAMLSWEEKEYPTNIRLCLCNTSVINSHIKYLSMASMIILKIFSPLITKNTLSSLEIRQLMLSFCVATVCVRLCSGSRPRLALSLTSSWWCRYIVWAERISQDSSSRTFLRCLASITYLWSLYRNLETLS